MKVKVNEAERETLDYMVAMAEGLGLGLTEEDRFVEIFLHQNRRGHGYCYSRDWSQGGPIIEREGIGLNKRNEHYLNEVFWQASYWKKIEMYAGPTPLIAAMRCYVASKLGDVVDVPNEINII